MQPKGKKCGFVESIQGIILAAGKGTRMKEAIPKVMITVEGIPMIKRIYEALEPNTDGVIIVVNNNYQLIEEKKEKKPMYVIQTEQKGTADALKSALFNLKENSSSLIVPADTPFLTKNIIENIVDYYYSLEATTLVVGMRVRFPNGYGRIKMENDKLIKIVEDKDATGMEKMNNIINTSIYIIPNSLIIKYIGNVKKSDVTGEYYLTELINVIAAENKVDTLIFPEIVELKGVNDLNALKALIKQKNAIIN